MQKWVWYQESLPCEVVIKLIVKDFLLQNIKKWTPQKKEERYALVFKEGKTYKAGAFWTFTKCNFIFLN